LADDRLIQAARAVLADLTPLDFDCGVLCGQKCCKDYAPDVGVYLLPGELPLFDGTEDWLTWQFHRTDDYDFAPSWSKHPHIPFMRCHRLCDREKRPLQCRAYPLAPYLNEDGTVDVRYDPFAEGVCPLVERYRVDQLRPEFVAGVRQAWAILMQDPELLDHVRWLTEQLKAWAELPHIDLAEEAT
jgi:hypothetical protein